MTTPEVPVIKQQSFTIGDTLGLAPVSGSVGIEWEMEGNKFPKSHDHPHYPKGWEYHNDGSLRGADNAEYVLSRPVPFDKVEEYVTRLFGCLKDYGTKLDDSNRTSVHVHLNVQKFHWNRLAAFLGMYFSLEEVLTAWCGENRVGNLFCLRGIDAPGIITKAISFIQNESKGVSLNSGLHYSGLNLLAVKKFGSVEIRTLRGVTDPDTVIKWVNILRRIYEMSETYKDPREVCESFSGGGALNYFETILGPYAGDVLTGSGMSYMEVNDVLYRGIRMAQDICYCRDWENYVEASLEKDPFDRSRRQSISSLSQYINTYMATSPSVIGWTPIDELVTLTNGAGAPAANWTIAEENPFEEDYEGDDDDDGYNEDEEE